MSSTAASFQIDTAIHGLNRAVVLGGRPDDKHLLVMTAKSTLGIVTSWGLLNVALHGAKRTIIVPPRWPLRAELPG